MFWFMEFCEIHGGYYNQIQLVTTRMGKKGTCLESLLLQPRALAGIIRGNYALPCVYCMSFKAALALPHIKISWAKMHVFQLMSCITHSHNISVSTTATTTHAQPWDQIPLCMCKDWASFKVFRVESHCMWSHAPSYLTGSHPLWATSFPHDLLYT